MDRPLGEDGRLGRPFGFVVVVLQRKQQRQIRVAVEGALIGAEIQRAKPRGKPVVSDVELLARFDNMFFGLPSTWERRQSRTASRTWIMPRIRERFRTANHSADAGRFLPDTDHAIVQAIGVRFDEIGRGWFPRWSALGNSGAT